MRWTLAFALIAFFGIVPEVRANSILNGDFESPYFANWLVQPAASGSLLFEGGSAHTGHSAAWFGAVSSLADTISQTFATTPGESYVTTFWLRHPGSDLANAFTVFWDGVPILNLVNAGAFGYTEYTFVEVAAGVTATLSFAGRDTLNFFQLDSVDVAPAEAPEPRTAVLFGIGLLALVPYARSRARLILARN